MNHEEFLKSVGRWDAHTYETPNRAVQAWKDMTSGYFLDLDAEMTLFENDGRYQGPVGMNKIAFSSLCEHHMLPFVGEAAVVYVPHSQLLGLSKLPRIVDCFSKRLQTQERLTSQIVEYIQTKVNPVGVFVRMESWHSCVSCRGILSRTARTTTVYGTGCFQDLKAQNDAYSLLFGG